VAGSRASCPLTVDLVIDGSGSINDNDATCKQQLIELGEELPARKFCFKMTNIYSSRLIDQARILCSSNTSNYEPDPQVSITLMRCHVNPAKFGFVQVLEPTRDSYSIDKGLNRLFKQTNSGHSCATGALKLVNKMINNEAEPITKHAVVIVSDGKLENSDSPKVKSIISKMKDRGVIVIGAPLFDSLSSKVAMKELGLASSSLVSSSVPTAKYFRISIPAHIPTCTAEQHACVDERSAILRGTLDDPERDDCIVDSLFTNIASCVPFKCLGINITEYKAKCVSYVGTNRDCLVNCKGIASNINAHQLITQDGNITFENGIMLKNREFDAQMPGSLQEMWSVNIAKNTRHSPIVCDASILIVAGSNELAGVDIAGHSLWEFKNPIFASATFSQPVSGSGDFFFVGDTEGILYQIHCHTGSIIKQWNVEGSISSAVLAVDDVVYVVAGDKLHKIMYQDKQFSSSLTLSVCPRSNLVDGLILVRQVQASLLIACESGAIKLIGLDGAILWEMNLDEPVFRAPSVGDTYLYVVSDLTILALSILDGSIQWVNQANVQISSLALLNDKLVCVLVNGDVRSYESSDGSFLSSGVIDSSETYSKTLPSSDSTGKLFLSLPQAIYVFDVNSMRLSYVIPEMRCSSPLLYETSMFVTCSQSKLLHFAQQSPDTRRMLTRSWNSTWPTSAIVVTVLLSIITLGLVVFHMRFK